jgi:hypothetical protein
MSTPDWAEANRETKLLSLLIEKLADKGILCEGDIDDLLYGTVTDRPPEAKVRQAPHRQ